MHYLNASKASINTRAQKSESKLIAALDALVLKDVANKVELESVYEEADSDVEIVAFGPVPIKPKKLLAKGVRRVVDENDPERGTRLTHPFFSKTSTSKQRTSGNAMTQQAGAQNTSQTRPMFSSGSMSKQQPASTSFLLYSYKEYTPKPTVVYTRHEEETNELISSLKHGPIGFDIEWRVLFRGNNSYSNRVAIVQVADGSGMILVIQIHPMSRFPRKLQELIENEEIPKLGVNITNDGKKLFDDYGILAKNLFELGKLVLLADPAGSETLANWKTKTAKWMIALAKLVEYYFGKTLNKDKKLRMGNWEAELEQPQIDYAANDAHCALKLYDRILELAQQNHIDLDRDLLQQQCSSSVASPYPKTLTKSVSCSEIPSKGKPGSVQRCDTMPNMPAAATNTSPQHLRAYRYWHERGMSMDKMCIELSLKSKGYGRTAARSISTSSTEYNEDGKATLQSDALALKPSTVISYVVGALQADPRLPFAMEKLRELVQMDAGSWERHRDWIVEAWSSGRGVVC